MDQQNSINTQGQHYKIYTTDILESVTPLALMNNKKRSVLLSTSMLSGIDSTTNESTLLDNKKMSKEMINTSFLYQPLDKKYSKLMGESTYALPLMASPALMSIENMVDVSVSEVSQDREREGDRTGTFVEKRKSQ